MSEELPKRLFKPGEETQVHQINNNCKMVRYFKRLKAWVPKELNTVKKDPVFAQIFKLFDNGLGFSARVIHSFLCRELVTYKDHELWFVFARRPLRFSLLEFHAVTGLQCDTSLSLKELVDWDDDGGFWSLVIKTNKGVSILELWENHRAAVKKWSNADRIRLVYLCIIVCIVCGRDEKAPIPIKYVKLVMDLEQVRNYPWGVASFDLLCESIAKTRDKLKENPKSYVLDGFTYGLQIWAMEAVPKLGKLCGRKLNKSFKDGPRCVNWMGAAKVSYMELNKLENIFTPKDDIYPYISWTGNYDVVENVQFSRRDEVEDDRIKLLMKMIMSHFDFSGHNWEYEETPVFSFGLDEVATNEGESGNDEVSNDKDGEGGSDEAAGSNEASGSDEEFQTPKGSATIGARDSKGKKRLPDRGMEKRKHKVLYSRAQQAPFDEDMKTFVTQLFQQNFAAMEERIEKKMGERFEELQSQLKTSRGDSSVEVEHGDPSASKPAASNPSPNNPAPSKPSPSKPSPSKPSPRRSKRLVKNH